MDWNVRLKRSCTGFIIFLLFCIGLLAPPRFFQLTYANPVNQTNLPFPRKVLMEFFTSTWCGPCATYGYLADELVEELGPNKVILCRNQCRNDGLNTPETDNRYNYYAIMGVPAVMMSGRFQSHPGETAKNRENVNKLLDEKSPFRISMKYSNDSVLINCLNGTSQAYSHLQLIVLLYEKLVFYEGQNGEKVHKNVVRDYMENETGISFPLQSNQSRNYSVEIAYPLDPEKEFCLVSFLQDTTTKEVYQAEMIEAKFIGESLPDLNLLDCILPKTIIEFEQCTIKLLVTNSGDSESGSCLTRLYLSTKEDWNIEDDLMIPEETIPRIQAGDISEVTFHFLFPDLGKESYPVWIVILVDSRNEIQEADENNLLKWSDPISVSDAPNKIDTPQPISPKEGETIVLPYRFEWSHFETASKYYLIVENISSNTNQTITKLTNQANYIFQKGDQDLLPGENYRWSVIAMLSTGGQSKASPWVTFSVNEAKPPLIITLQIGNHEAYIQKDNEKEIVFIDVAPFIVNNRTVVPVRFIGESFGAEVRWNNLSKEINVVFDDKMVIFWLENKQAKIVDMRDSSQILTISLEIAPFIVQNRTVIPLRILSEVFGASVDWDSATQKINITLLR